MAAVQKTIKQLEKECKNRNLNLPDGKRGKRELVRLLQEYS